LVNLSLGKSKIKQDFWLIGWFWSLAACVYNGKHRVKESEQSMSAELAAQTKIFKLSQYGEEQLGYVGSDQIIYKVRWGQGVTVGRVDEQGHVFRKTAHDERELGRFTPTGQVYSHGLFEGGALGWVDPDGVVVQGGLILGEEEVGRIDGPQAAAAAAALLLLFLPDDAEANKRMSR
jgi:hypothetical protein